MQQVKEQVCYVLLSHTGSCIVWFVNLPIPVQSWTKPFNSAELISAFFSFFQDQPQLLPGWLTEYKSVWQSLPRHTWGLSAFGAVLGVSEAKGAECAGHGTPGAHGPSWAISSLLAAHSAVIFREVKFREIGGGEKWGSVNTGCTSGRLKNTVCRGRDF